MVKRRSAEEKIIQKTAGDFLKMKVYKTGKLQAIRKLAYNQA
jgi:hypothetical protein